MADSPDQTKRSGRVQLLPLFLLSIMLTALLTGCGSRQTVSGMAQTEAKPTAKESAIVRTARKAIGTEYQYGGCNPAEGFDCSGLIWWAFRENGYAVPRTTTAQSKAGQPVDCSYPRQGDVIVFRISHKGLHSGIYSGNGHFVHSPKSGHVVREESMQKDYWQSRLLTCRRFLP